jgi:hypothetical protein
MDSGALFREVRVFAMPVRTTLSPQSLHRLSWCVHRGHRNPCTGSLDFEQPPQLLFFWLYFSVVLQVAHHRHCFSHAIIS